MNRDLSIGKGYGSRVHVIWITVHDVEQICTENSTTITWYTETKPSEKRKQTKCFCNNNES